MKINSLVIAEGVSVDAFTGRITAFNMLDAIFLPAIPAMLPRLHVLVCSEGGPQAKPLYEQVRIMDGTNELMVVGPVEINLGTAFHTSIHSFWGLKFERFGDHTVEVQQRGDLNGEWKVAASRVFVTQKGHHPLMAVPPPQEKSVG